MDRTTLAGTVAIFVTVLGGLFLYEGKKTKGEVISEHLYDGLKSKEFMGYTPSQYPYYEFRIEPLESSPRNYVVRGDLTDLRRLDLSIKERDWVKINDIRKPKNSLGQIVVSASDVQK